MGSVTLYVIIIVSLVQFQVILCKPFLFDLICDLVCDDDDNTTTSNSSDDYFGFDDICSCGTQAPPTTRKGNVPNVDLNLPGVSLQMTNTNGQWSLNVNTNPSTPANSVIPLPTGGSAGSAVPVSPLGPGSPGGPQFPGTSPVPGGPASPIVPGVSGAPPGPTTAAAATTAAASTAAPP